MSGKIASLWEALGRLWCHRFHSAPMWPAYGCYRCPDCHRTYPVVWANRLMAPLVMRAANRPVSTEIRRAA